MSYTKKHETEILQTFIKCFASDAIVISGGSLEIFNLEEFNSVQAHLWFQSRSKYSK